MGDTKIPLSVEDLRTLVVRSVQRSISSDLIDRLLVGIPKNDLDEAVGGELPRMNLIGSLRASGLIIEGGRGGGKTYRVVGYEEKKSGLPLKEWDIESQRAVEALQSSPVSSRDYDRVVRRIQNSLSPTHENCPLEIYSYELGSSSTWGYWYGNGIVIQRFSNRPVFKFRPFDMQASDVIDVCHLLGQLSCRPVQVVAISKEYARSLKTLLPAGSITRTEQAIYDPVRLSRETKSIWSRSDHDRFRRSARDTMIREVEGGEASVTYLLDTWKDTVGERQRQLSIGRDYTAASIDIPKITFLGLRGDLPVTCQIVDHIPGTTIACTIVEKSMNYSWQPNGRSGTSDWCLIEVCRSLVEKGFTSLNYGAIAGGSEGLSSHKRKLLSDVTYSYGFNTGLRRSEA